ncbi:MAG: hypothetical protein OSA02_06535 [Schleiferiaceae bacterium]|nr:hypothetical protein [Schleiferiaceae bacterium]
MRAAVIFFLFICSFIGRSQSNTLDSLANRVNNEHRPFKKSLTLGAALQYLVPTDFELVDLKSKLNIADLKTGDLLAIDAFKTRRMVARGTYTYDPNDVVTNPYALHYRSVYLFNQGEIQTALKYMRYSFQKFVSLQDSSYASSVSNNLGAGYWAIGNLDSALLFFKQCQSYASWYQEMTEANILGLATTISDTALALEQIAIINKENPNCINPVYLSNLYYFSAVNDSSKIDSVSLIIQTAYPAVSDVPSALLDIFIINNWQTTGAISRLMSEPNTPYFRLGVNSLLKSKTILSGVVTDSVLDILYKKIDDDQTKSLLRIYFNTNTEARKNILTYLNDPDLNSENIDSSRERLKKLVAQYRAEKIVSEKSQQRLVYLFFTILTLILLAIVIIQRAKIEETKKVGVLTIKNNSLEAEQLELSQELSEVRKSLTSIARENIQKLDQLRILMKDLDNTDTNRSLMFKDLNIIRTHQEGVTRFKIGKFCDDLNGDVFESIEKLVSKKETQLLKLIALEFRSKEIAVLLNVSPQYVNNQRHKIKVLLQLHGYDFDKFLSNVKTGLFK